MDQETKTNESGCGCDCSCDRREFLASASLAAVALTSAVSHGGTTAKSSASKKQGAKVRALFIYPPSESFAGPDGWWSWPGNDFDAEGRQRRYSEEIKRIEQKLGMTVSIDATPVASSKDVERVSQEIAAQKPDGLLLVLFYNGGFGQASAIVEAAEKAGIPTVFYVGLGVKHGSIAHLRRPGIYFVQSLENFEAVEYGLRMINAKKLMTQSRLLSINESKPSEAVEPFLGVTVQAVPFSRYVEAFERAKIDAATENLIAELVSGAQEVRGVTSNAIQNAARAHVALTQLLAEENADGLTMNCLRRGMLKPCLSFSILNGQLIPAACENDLRAAYTQLMGQLLTGRAGFQHNPCYETEKNHYYASHCTCPTRLEGPDGPQLPYLLRRFAHTNEGSCAIQVFWKPGDPVTMVRYYPGETPELDVYAGRVVASHPMPPAAGCTTNVEIELTDRSDACMVVGHHNLLFSGDLARKFRLFAQLYKIRLADTGYAGPLRV